MADQIYKVRDPSGALREISGPEGATDEQIIEQAKLLFGEKERPVDKSVQESEFIKHELTSPLRKVGGVAESALQMLTGASASAAGGLRGLYGLATGDTAEDAARKVQETQQAMTYQPRLEEGRAISEAVAMPMEYASKATGYLGGKAGGMFGPKAEAAGQTIGEAIPPIAATMLSGVPAVKSIAKTKFTPPSVPEVPIVSDFARGMRDVVRTRSKGGERLLAEEYLQKMTTPAEAPKIIAALERRGAPIVPDSPVTAADAIARANREMALKGSPERFGGQYVALQEGLASLPETTSGLTSVKLLQEKARADVMKAGAGTERGYAAAELARKSATAPLYKKLTDSNAIVDTAKTVNLIERITEARSGNKALVTALDDVKSSLIDNLDDANAYILKSNPGVLKSSIENINSLLTKQENLSIRRELMTVKKSLESQINKVEGAYGKAQEAYAVNSLPLNQMDLWRTMQEKFITPTGKEAPGSYLKSLRDEAKLIKQATGFKRGDDIKSIFNQEQSALAARLAAEMEMELLKKRMVGEVNISGIGKAAEGLEPKLPNMLMRETMVANFILRTLAKNANVDVNIAAANILKDPKQLAGVLKQIKPEHRSTALKTIRETAVTKAGAAAGTALMETEEQQ